MRGKPACLLVLGVALAAACGGTVEHVPFAGSGGAANGGRAGAGHAGSGHAGSSGFAGLGGSSGGPADAGFDEYVDPGCPDAAPSPPSYACDPFALVSG